MCERCQNWKKPLFKTVRLNNKEPLYTCMKCNLEIYEAKKSVTLKNVVNIVGTALMVAMGSTASRIAKNVFLSIIFALLVIIVIGSLQFLLYYLINKNTEYEFRPIQGLHSPENKSEDVDSIQN